MVIHVEVDEGQNAEDEHSSHEDVDIKSESFSTGKTMPIYLQFKAEVF